jgi:hypothetical protein
VSTPKVLPELARGPSAAGEAAAGVVVAVASVLAAAPVGLLWAALAPRVTVVIAAGKADLSEGATPAYIAGDGWFVGVTLVVGLVAGLLVLALGRRYGPGVVLGLALGGLLGAEVARRTGHLVGLDDAKALVRSGRDGRVQLAPTVRSWQTLAVWPVAALAVHLVGQLAAPRLAATGDGGGQG